MKALVVDDLRGVPNRDAKAEPIAWSKPSAGRTVVFVEKAVVRHARISAAHFLVADVVEPINTYAGTKRIEVECYWFGKKNRTRWMNLTISGGFRFVENYVGDVVTNIGRRADCA